MTELAHITPQFERLQRLGRFQGEVALPCVPALADSYLAYLVQLLQLAGLKLSPERQAELAAQLHQKLDQGYRCSQHSELIIRYHPATPPQLGLVLDLQVQINSLKSFYEKTVNEHFGDRLETMETEVFGKLANAKVTDVAAQLRPGSKVLDIGAGSGRNTLPLARLGLQVEAIELAEIFSGQLQHLSDREGLGVKVMQADILNPLVRLPLGYYDLVILAEIIPHFREPAQVRLVLAKICDGVCPHGQVLLNTFIAHPNYIPTAADRQLAQVSQAFFLTEPELDYCLQGLPLQLVSRQPVYDYEREHLPEVGFPPSPWFEPWTRGALVFGHEQAIALEWLLFRRL
ncbi:MAG: class I SAM-dependent methyltransferase [Pseudanabaenaceae cyanobacterium bins.68]|nr:class I SAM-dependent methyltransferase [Pseudanabaenaceae cyanobacterium bins.68]